MRFFAHYSVIFGPNSIFIYSCTQASADQELSIKYLSNYFWTKVRNTKLLGHIWAWAWHIAHLAQRSKNFGKSFPYRWGNGYFGQLISQNHYPQTKINYSPLNTLNLRIFSKITDNRLTKP